MREKTNRRKKVKLNYKRMAAVLFVLILIVFLTLFGIKAITKNSKVDNEKNGNNNQEEQIIPKDTTINLVAIGDIMCHSTNFKAAYNSTTKEYDFSPVFANVAKYITKADIAIRKSRNNICRRRKRI